MATTRKAAQRKLAEISRTYHAAIPLTAMFDACKEAGLVPVQEDGEEWTGLLCGDDSRASFRLRDSRSTLEVQWYKLASGRYEVNAYIS